MIKRLAHLNNVMACAGIPVDIVTITGFMNDAQCAAHLQRYETEAFELANEANG